MTHIYLVAPSYPLKEEEAKATKEYLESLGMRVTLPSPLLGEDLLCAHGDEVRFSHLKAALEDPSIDIIWMLKGGYGLTPLLPSLLSLSKPGKEKLFIGFSDGTALHIFLNSHWKWPTLHGPGATQLPQQKIGEQTINQTLNLLAQGWGGYQPPRITPYNEQARNLSSLEGKILGGNLCLVECSLGTEWQLNPRNSILFLEDVDERGYRIDRMLTHLQQAQLFQGVKALLLGDFVGGEEKDGSSLVEPVLKRFSETIDVPVFRVEGCGHGKENYPLPFNMDLRLL
jgi:muramoyltetrapeptide carboxypeptidase